MAKAALDSILKGWIDRVLTFQFVMYSAADLSPERFAAAKRAYARRLDRLFTDDPIPFRSLAGGDYDRDLRLLPPGVEPSGTSGQDLHTRPYG